MEQVFLENFDPMQMPSIQEQIASESQKKKRPANAFIRYCLENRKFYRDTHPEMSNIEVSSLLAAEWNKLTEDQKKPYRLSAKEEQMKFKEENPQYGYEKARTRRSIKKNNDFPKQNFDIPDITTLVNLPPDELKQCMYALQNHVLLQYLNLQSFTPENDPNLHLLEETLTHVFQTQQQQPSQP